MRLLLVGDDVTLWEGLKRELTAACHAVDWVTSESAARSIPSMAEFGAVLLQLSPANGGCTGVAVLRALSGRPVTVPVIAILDSGGAQERAVALDHGADDCLALPVHLDELCARLRAIRRRMIGRTTALLSHGPIVMDTVGYTVQVAGRRIELSPKEFALLQILVENAGRVLSRRQLEAALYCWRDELGSNAIEVHVHHLRRKLGVQLIRTVRGIGYVLEPSSADAPAIGPGAATSGDPVGLMGCAPTR